MIDYFCHWTSEDAAKQDAVRLRNYFGVGSSATIQTWYTNQFLPNVQAWRPSQDVTTISSLGSPIVTHSYLTGWFGILALDHIEPVIINDNSLAFALDRDGPPYVIKNNIGAVLQDVACAPIFAGSHYPLGGWSS